MKRKNEYKSKDEIEKDVQNIMNIKFSEKIKDGIDDEGKIFHKLIEEKLYRQNKDSRLLKGVLLVFSSDTIGKKTDDKVVTSVSKTPLLDTKPSKTTMQEYSKYQVYKKCDLAHYWGHKSYESHFSNRGAKSDESHFLKNNTYLRNVENFENVESERDELFLAWLEDETKNKKGFPLNVAIDTEFQYYIDNHGNKKRFLISTQFSITFDGLKYFNFVFINYSFNEHELKFYLSIIFKWLDDNLGFQLYKYQIQLTLLFHNSKADLSIFTKEYKDFFFSSGLLKEIQGTDISLEKRRFSCVYMNQSSRDTHKYTYTLNIKDTMLYAVGEKSLKAVGANTHLGKLDIKDEIDMSDMLGFLFIDTLKFLRYAMRDSLVTLDIANDYFGVNQKLPVSIGSYGVYLCREFLKSQFNLKNVDEFELFYRGRIRNREKGKVLNSKGKVVENIEYSYVSESWEDIYKLGAKAYYGGLNQCYSRGVVNEKTYDFDLKNAYPSMMSTIPVIDHNKKVQAYINPSVDTVLDLMSERQIFSLDLAVCDFDYDKLNKEYERYSNMPIIPQKIDGSLVFSRRNGNNVFLSGPELFRALEIGVITKIHKYYKVPVLKSRSMDGSIIQKDNTFFGFIKWCVEERFKAKKNKDKILDKFWKLVINSLYGKIGQGLRDSRVITYKKDKTISENMPDSSITNSIYAAYITSLCRVILHDTMICLTDKGYKNYSVTTDGFISNAPFEVVSTILSKYENTLFTHNVLTYVRKMLNDESTNYYEVKHVQDLFLNFSTRGNIALSGSSLIKRDDSGEIIETIDFDGVNAKMGFKGFNKDYLEPIDLIADILENDYVLEDSFLKATLTRHMLYKEKDYDMSQIKKMFKFEYDFKRKPVLESIRYEEIDLKGKKYEMLCFDTEPWETIDEFYSMKKSVRHRKDVVSGNREKLIEFMNKKQLQDKVGDKRNVISVESFEVRNFIILYAKEKKGKSNVLSVDLKLFLKKLKQVGMVDMFNKITNVKTTVDSYRKTIEKTNKGVLDITEDLIPYNLIKKIEQYRKGDIEK